MTRLREYCHDPNSTTAYVLAIETSEKANSCEPFIEVDDTLNKLKNGDVI